MHAGHLVAEDQRHGAAELAVDDVQVGVAHAARGDVDDLAGRIGFGVVGHEAEIRVERLENDGSHLPALSSSWAGPGTSGR